LPAWLQAIVRALAIALVGRPQSRRGLPKMINRPSLFGSRDSHRDADRNAPQTRPNPAQPPSPAVEAVRAPSDRSTASDRLSTASADAQALQRGLTTPPAGSGPLAAPAATPRPADPTPSADGYPTASSDRVTSVDAQMVVGPNIKMRGVEINDCDTLIVQGSVEATMDARQIEIAPGGSYTGKASVDNAEIHGLYTGELTVRKRLVIHATGKVGGTLRYGKMVVEEGGEIAGDIRALGQDAKPQGEIKAVTAETKPAEEKADPGRKPESRQASLPSAARH
jgi:cytoskeletal protein CcmA (bactofilin family)